MAKQQLSLFDRSSMQITQDVQNIFQKESELCDYLEKNIKVFMYDLFGEQYESHTREYKFQNKGTFKIKKQTMKKRGNRIDFLVSTKSKNTYLIEVKNYQKARSTNLAAAIGQLLGYGALYKQHKDKKAKLVLVASDFETLAADTVLTYDLPVDIALLRKEGMYLMEK